MNESFKLFKQLQQKHDHNDPNQHHQTERKTISYLAMECTSFKDSIDDRPEKVIKLKPLKKIEVQNKYFSLSIKTV